MTAIDTTTSDATEQPAIDETRVMEVAQRVAFDHAVAAGVAMAELGDRLGLYRAMVGAGPLDAATLAASAGCEPRLVEEWLCSQAASGYVTYDPATDRFELGAEEALVLGIEQSPAFVGGISQIVRALFAGSDRLVDAFHADGSVSWGEHHECLFAGMDRFFGNAYRNHLVQEWVPGVVGLDAALRNGGRLLDLGCGSGISLLTLAAEYPAATFVGVDAHRPAIEKARAAALAAGVDDRVSFEVGTVADIPLEGHFDAVCFFEALHDMGDPDTALRRAGEHLRPGGAVVAAEVQAPDTRAEQVAEPMARLNFAASTALCTPGALSQHGPRALGNQVGLARWKDIFGDNGFAQVEVVGGTPSLMIIAAYR